MWVCRAGYRALQQRFGGEGGIVMTRGQSRGWNLAVNPRTATAACLLTAVFVLVIASKAQAQTYQVIYNFTGGSDGSSPEAGLTMDRGGNLYGTTSSRGPADVG